MRVFLLIYLDVFTLLVGYTATMMAQAATVPNLQSPVQCPLVATALKYKLQRSPL